MKKEVEWHPTKIKKNFGVRAMSALNAGAIDKEEAAKVMS